jgi:hypothetical protein
MRIPRTDYYGIVLIAPKRIVILGLYNSGSTVLAGMLHRMGVNMGAPFWMTSEEGHPENFYESWQLSRQVRKWWGEPLAEERFPAADRIQFLQAWANQQEIARPGPLGAKHPLLSLCAADLLAAWGPETYFVRAWRSLEDSVEGLRRRDWFPGHELALQTRLCRELNEFEHSNPPAVTLDWNRVKSNPSQAAAELASALGLNPTTEQLASAAALIRLPESHRQAA